MKSLIASAMLCVFAVGASATDQKSAGSAPKAVTIPKSAVANTDGTYSYTDEQGKKWTFLKTPFGIIKRPATATDGPTAAAAPDNTATNNTTGNNTATKAIDKGDTVRFERKSPFGTVTWEKKKADLTEEERQILAAQNAKTDK